MGAVEKITSSTKKITLASSGEEAPEVIEVSSSLFTFSDLTAVPFVCQNFPGTEQWSSGVGCEGGREGGRYHSDRPPHMYTPHTSAGHNYRLLLLISCSHLLFIEQSPVRLADLGGIILSYPHWTSSSL